MACAPTVSVVMTRRQAAGPLMVGLLLVAACGERAAVDPPGSMVSTAMTSTATTVLSTTTTTEPAYQPVPFEEIDTVAATEVFFPRTEAQHAAWGDRHN